MRVGLVLTSSMILEGGIRCMASCAVRDLTISKYQLSLGIIIIWKGIIMVSWPPMQRPHSFTWCHAKEIPPLQLRPSFTI